MAEPLDLYHLWLGISPKYQPADHYRLLGVDRFEPDPQVIREAAQRQMGHVRHYQAGAYQADAIRILNELGTAKACLLDPVKKGIYDLQLAEHLAAHGNAGSAVLPQQAAVGGKAGTAQAVRTVRPVSNPTPVPLVGKATHPNAIADTRLETPTFASSVIPQGRQGELLRFRLHLGQSDRAAHSCRYELAEPLTGANIDRETAEFSWQIPLDFEPRQLTLNIQVRDSQNSQQTVIPTQVEILPRAVGHVRPAPAVSVAAVPRDTTAPATVQWLTDRLLPLREVCCSSDGRWCVASIEVEGQPRPVIWDLGRGAFAGAHKLHDWKELIGPQGELIVDAETDRDLIQTISPIQGGPTHCDSPAERPHGERGKLLGVAGEALRPLAFSPDGRQLLSHVFRHDGHRARLWDTTTGKPLAELLGQRDFIRAGAFSYDGQWAATASWDGTAALWTLPSGKMLQRYTGAFPRMLAIYVEPRCQLVVTGHREGVVVLWDLATGKQRRTLVDPLRRDVHAVACNDHGTEVWTWSAQRREEVREGGPVQVWQTSSGLVSKTLPAQAETLTGAALCPERDWVLTCEASGTIAVWHAGSGAVVARLGVFREGDQYRGLTVTGRGYFHTTAASGNLPVQARVGGQVLTLDEYRIRYGQPEQVTTGLQANSGLS